MNHTIINLLNNLKNQWKNGSQPPRTILKLIYENSNKSTKPIILLETEEPMPNQYYSLIMVDPDAPSSSNPIYADFVHWIITNMILENNRISQGNQIIEYMKPTPPPGSGSHHYISLLFQHKTPALTEFKIEKRSSHNTNKLMKRILPNDAILIGFYSFTFER